MRVTRRMQAPEFLSTKTINTPLFCEDESLVTPLKGTNLVSLSKSKHNSFITCDLNTKYFEAWRARQSFGRQAPECIPIKEFPKAFYGHNNLTIQIRFTMKHSIVTFIALYMEYASACFEASSCEDRAKLEMEPASFLPCCRCNELAK
jgi:hypothetical protein